MSVYDHLRTPGDDRRYPRLGLPLRMGEPVAVGVEVVVARSELERLPRGEVVDPVVALRIGLAPDVLVVQVGEGIATVGVEHRVDEDHRFLQNLNCGRIVPRRQVFEKLEQPFAPRKLEAVDRATIPEDGGLVRDDRGRLLGRGAARIAEPLGRLANRIESRMVLGRRHDSDQQGPAFPRRALFHDADPVRCGGQRFEVADHLMMLRDPLAELVARHLCEARDLGGGAARENQHGRKQGAGCCER